MLILVRHGESTGNAEGRLLGRIDSPLTGRGLEQARSLAATVTGATRLISSPLLRAHLGGVGAARLVGDRCDGCHLTLPSVELELSLIHI